MSHIPLSEMQHGRYYRGICQNSRMARWDSTAHVFVILRDKYDRLFPDTIEHVDDSAGYDTFEPHELLDEGAELTFIPLTTEHYREKE